MALRTACRHENTPAFQSRDRHGAVSSRRDFLRSDVVCHRSLRSRLSNDMRSRSRNEVRSRLRRLRSRHP